ncbi:MAG: winged helix-turn-helix transcriptional regulator [Chloroflexi bacterium]|nr:MAG: winged helix-turn-helix transcriptional regulator [Chloroflexota bacterium]
MLPLQSRWCACLRKRSIDVMARVNTPSQPVTELYLIQGEQPDTRDLDDARQWVTIYRELVTFADRTLSRLRREKGANLEADGSNASDADERGMEGHLRRLQSRLDFWERRLWELAGLDLDVRRRVLNYAGQRLTLTRREAELLAFLARRPGQFFPAAQLVSLAWASPELSAEQLRTYVVRLRRHLASTGVPARLVSEPRRGYGLVFTA